MSSFSRSLISQTWLFPIIQLGSSNQSRTRERERHGQNHVKNITHLHTSLICSKQAKCFLQFAIAAEGAGGMGGGVVVGLGCAKIIVHTDTSSIMNVQSCQFWTFNCETMKLVFQLPVNHSSSLRLKVTRVSLADISALYAFKYLWPMTRKVTRPIEKG